MKRIAGLLLVALAVGGVLWADSALSITGAGATFPYPMYSKWFDEYHNTITRETKRVTMHVNHIYVMNDKDCSGTTYISTGYQSKVNEERQDKVRNGAWFNRLVSLGAKPNQTVTGTIKNTTNSSG